MFSVCRALGLPCRCVTNYVSAHDTNASLSVDKFYDEDGEELTEAPSLGTAAGEGVTRGRSELKIFHQCDIIEKYFPPYAGLTPSGTSTFGTRSGCAVLTWVTQNLRTMVGRSLTRRRKKSQTVRLPNLIILLR